MITSIKEIMPKDYNACTCVTHVSKLVGLCAVRLFLAVAFYVFFDKSKFRYDGTAWRYSPTREDRRNGVHGLNLVKIRPWGLSINMNVAKNIFGENISEITEDHAPLIMELIRTHLNSIGIRLLPGWEKNLKPKGMEISKNLLVAGITGRHAISLLKREIDVSGHNKIGDVEYPNGGERISYGTKHKQWTLYDKTSEIEAYESRRANGKIISPVYYIEKLAKNRIGLLRMEYRLQKGALTQYFKEIGIRNPCLLDVFNSRRAYNLLTTAWQNLPFNARVGTDTDNAEFWLEKIARTEPDRKVLDVLGILGLLSLEKTLNRVETRELLMSIYDKQSVRYALKKLGSNTSPTGKYSCGELSSIFETINNQLEQWTPLNTMADLTPDTESLHKGAENEK